MSRVGLAATGRSTATSRPARRLVNLSTSASCWRRLPRAGLGLSINKDTGKVERSPSPFESQRTLRYAQQQTTASARPARRQVYRPADGRLSWTRASSDGGTDPDVIRRIARSRRRSTHPQPPAGDASIPAPEEEHDVSPEVLALAARGETFRRSSSPRADRRRPRGREGRSRELV